MSNPSTHPEMFDLDSIGEVWGGPADAEGGAADGGDAAELRSPDAGPGQDQGLRGFAVEVVPCRQCLRGTQQMGRVRKQNKHGHLCLYDTYVCCKCNTLYYVHVCIHR